MSRLAKRFRIWFRSWYEQQLSLPFGINQFLANFAFIQLTPHEYVELNPPSSHCGTLRLTSKDARPVVTFKYWPPGAEYKEFSNVQVILEEGSRQTRNFRFQVREEVPQMKVTSVDAKEKTVTLEGIGPSWTDWEIATLKDHRIEVLRDLFLGFAFYAPMRAEHKKKIVEAVK